MTDVFLGIDLGTTSVKVLALDARGRELARGEAPAGLLTPEPGFAEIDPRDAVRAVRTAVAAAAAGLGAGERVRALGFSCAMHGLLAVDAAGAPLGRVLTWLDRRAAPIADRWRRDGTAAALYARTGAPMHPMLPSCKLAWLAEHEPALHRAAARFVSLKEWLVFGLCGEWLVDPGIASATGLLDVRRRAWDPGALGLAGIDESRLSSLAHVGTRRTLDADAAATLGLQPGVELVLGSSDGALANLGSGAVDPGTWTLTMGTSGALRALTPEPYLDLAGRTFCYVADDARWLSGGATSSAGAVVAAFAELLFADAPEDGRIGALVAAATRAPDDALPVVVPFLAGERAPYWRADLRGAIEDLALGTGRDRLARAILEATVFALAEVGLAMRDGLGRPRAIRGSGHLANVPAVRALAADVFECEVRVAERGDGAAIGAAWLAAIALGAASEPELVATLTTDAPDEPDAARAVRVSRRFARYRAAVAERVKDAGS